MESLITTYKEKLLASITACPELIALISPAHVADGVCINTEELLYSQIFPYNYIPDPHTEANYITMKVELQEKTSDPMYRQLTVTVSVLSHQTLMQMENESPPRTDQMGAAIETLFSDREDFGFGKMQIKSDLETNPAANYHCREIAFTVEEFAR